MNRKILSLVLMLFILLSSATAFAFDPNEDEIGSKHVLLMEAQSGAVLYEKNADEQAYPASTTKIMSAIVVLENGNLDDMVTVGNEINRFGSGSSLAGLKEHEEISLRDLLYGMMLVSGNDAAATIAVHMAGSISEFADMMNEKAAQIGMTGTHFTNPHGVQNEEHYTTARDMSKLAAYAMKNSDFRALVKTKTYTSEPTNKSSEGHYWENTNMLVNTTQKNKDKNLNYTYSYATGIKTGDTDYAKRCLVASAEKNGISLICVLLYDPENYRRFEDAKNLFEWGFSNFTTKNASELDLQKSIDVRVLNCSFDEDDMLMLDIDLSDKQISCTAEEWENIKNNEANITMTLAPIGEISAPVKQGDLLASVAYKFEDNTLFKADAYASRDVQAMGEASESPNLPSINMPGTKQDSPGPWLFFILVIAALLLIVGISVLVISRRKYSRRRRKRGVYAYRR